MEWLNYHHLLYFWVVAREGGLTRASKALNLMPQTISTQLRSLEAALGQELFNRTGRRLVLTEVGQVAFHYADEIFKLGRELTDTLKGQPIGRPLKLRVGIADVLPKLIVHQLIAPALQLEKQIQIICHEGKTDMLLSELAVHAYDVVLSDTPIPPAVKIRAFNHLLGECGVTFMATGRLVPAHRKGFPGSLDGAPFLLPTEDTILRRSLDRWFDARGIRPRVVGEFADSALLQVFGQVGEGIFAIPSVIEAEVQRQYRARSIGLAHGITERFYAISIERKIQHPAVAAICDNARAELFK